MPTLFGTPGSDLLNGTEMADLLVSNGGDDTLSGGAGADTYQLTVFDGPASLVIDDAGGDGAIDRIIGTKGLYQVASLGYSAWALAERIDDDLHLTLPSRPYRFRKASYGELDLEIRDHFAGDAVEEIVFASVTYQLAASAEGSLQNDIIAGTRGSDALYGFAGDDFITGNRGRDSIWSGDGDDTVFGGAGRNRIDLGNGNDRVFGDKSRDIVYGRDGDDQIYAGEGKNIVRAGNGNDHVTAGAGDDRVWGHGGNDRLHAGDGNNRVFGGQGNDVLQTGAGNSLLVGGKDGDDYLVGVDEASTIRILDRGNAPAETFYATATFDDVILGADGWDGGVLRGLDVEIAGDDLVLRYAAPGATGSETVITISRHFDSARFAMERVGFGASETSARLFNVAHLGGDNRTYSVHSRADAGADDLVLGTTGDDVIYSGFGTDIVVGGGGADRFVFEDEGDNRGGIDIIRDFDITDDLLDFTEIAALVPGDLAITQSAYGNALISSLYGDIELIGVDAADIDFGHRIFVFTDADLPIVDLGSDTSVTPVVIDGARVHTGTSAADILKGGDGVDQFIFKPDTAFAAVDTIKDFTLGDGDVLDVSALLIGFNAESDTLEDFVVLLPEADESFVTLAVDRDGPGSAFDSTPIATLQDHPDLTLGDLVADDLLIL